MIFLQCRACQKELRALDRDQGQKVKCPCGADVWIPGGERGLWIGLAEGFMNWLGWKCPHCQGKLHTDATVCSHCNGALPTLVKPS
jgi:hypothetical protein